MPEEDDVALARLRGYPSAEKGAAVYRERRGLGASGATSLIRAGETAKERDGGRARRAGLAPHVAASAFAQSPSVGARVRGASSALSDPTRGPRSPAGAGTTGPSPPRDARG
jgi:hypothetical protein